ncbi:MAG TPA: hypothetical protein VN974_11990 [Candidatus Dormibacteraeota bacterium]|nr:hypothetical protein [Candidatus Dormibacteraeota bacterium]
MSITKHGLTLSSEQNGRSSKPVGTILYETTGDVVFTPVPGMKFSHQLLHEISEFVRSMAEAHTSGGGVINGSGR